MSLIIIMAILWIVSIVLGLLILSFWSFTQKKNWSSLRQLLLSLPLVMLMLSITGEASKITVTLFLGWLLGE